MNIEFVRVVERVSPAAVAGAIGLSQSALRLGFEKAIEAEVEAASEAARGVRSSAEMTEPTNHMNGLIERSSFGDVEATAARENVSDEKARDLVERSKRMSQDHTNRSNEGESR